MKIAAVAILENPFAGKGRSGKKALWLQQELLARKISCTHFKEDWPADFNGYSDIWLVGGDGTINYFINRYPDCDKVLALFKGGTGNDFAWKLYGDTSDEAQLAKILEAHPRSVDAGKCNQHLFINCLGIGFDGEIVRSMRSIRLLGGHLGYLLAVVLKIFGFREHHFVIRAGGEIWKQRLLLMMIVNSSRAGGGFYIAPDASIDDGKLDMVLCGEQTLLKRLKYLPVIKAGKHMRLPFITHRQGMHFQVSCDEEMALQLDGELLHAKELVVEVLAGKFLFRY
ncbi:MAG: diacylglycerol kinase family protein [Bacteroidota bacterium]